MSLMQILKDDQLVARKARNTVKASLLTTLIGVAKKDTDAQILHALADEADILESYLPKQLTIEQIDNYLTQAVFHDGLELNKGKMMKYLKDNFTGQYDGKVAAQVIDVYLKG